LKNSHRAAKKYKKLTNLWVLSYLQFLKNSNHSFSDTLVGTLGTAYLQQTEQSATTTVSAAETAAVRKK